ncbi:MAG: hypothetical protein ABID09_02185 [Candidatus Omnitrophota bacterium]
MFIRNLSRRERSILAFLVVVAVSAVFYTLIIDPVVAYWKNLDNEIEANGVALGKDMKLLKMYDALQREHAKYEDFIETGKNEEEELAKTLSVIESVSTRSACRIANVKPRSSRELGNYREFVFEVTAEGGIDELTRFTYEIELSKEYLRIKRFTIISKLGSEGTLKSTFLISRIVLI